MRDDHRPHTTLLLAASYAFSCDIATRYADMDPYKHINNVAVAELYEEARASFLRWLMQTHEGLERGGWLVADQRIRYLAEIRYPSTLRITAGVADIGRRAFSLRHGLFLGDRCMGICETVAVHSHGHGAVEIPPRWRTALSSVQLTLADTA